MVPATNRLEPAEMDIAPPFPVDVEDALIEVPDWIATDCVPDIDTDPPPVAPFAFIFEVEVVMMSEPWRMIFPPSLFMLEAINEPETLTTAD